MSWPLATLGSVAEIVSGSTPKTGVAEFWGGEIPWVTPADLTKRDDHFIESTPRTLTQLGLKNSGAKILPVGSVLFSSRAPIGHVAITAVPMATNQGFKSFVPDPAQLDAKYLFWWLRSQKGYLQSLGVGATFKEVSKAIVSAVCVPLPPLPEQRRIASVLDRVDLLRDRRRRAIVLLDDSLDAAFESVMAACAFGQSISLGEVATIDAPMVDPRLDVYAHHGLVTPDLIEKNTGRLSGRPPTVNEIGPISGKYLFDAQHVLYSKIRPALNKVLLPESGGLCSADMYPIRLLDADLSRAYVWAELRTKRFLDFATSYANRAQMPKLNRAQLLAYSFPRPTLRAQRDFSLVVSAVEFARDRQLAQLVKFDELFASLQHRAFNGER